jgi:hypothetical protein
VHSAHLHPLAPQMEVANIVVWMFLVERKNGDGRPHSPSQGQRLGRKNIWDRRPGAAVGEPRAQHLARHCGPHNTAMPGAGTGPSRARYKLSPGGSAHTIEDDVGWLLGRDSARDIAVADLRADMEGLQELQDELRWRTAYAASATGQQQRLQHGGGGLSPPRVPYSPRQFFTTGQRGADADAEQSLFLDDDEDGIVDDGDSEHRVLRWQSWAQEQRRVVARQHDSAARARRAYGRALGCGGRLRLLLSTEHIQVGWHAGLASGGAAAVLASIEHLSQAVSVVGALTACVAVPLLVEALQPGQWPWLHRHDHVGAAPPPPPPQHTPAATAAAASIGRASQVYVVLVAVRQPQRTLPCQLDSSGEVRCDDSITRGIPSLSLSLSLSLSCSL